MTRIPRNRIGQHIGGFDLPCASYKSDSVALLICLPKYICNHALTRNEQVSWFVVPTVALIEQQCEVIKSAIPVSVGRISGSSEPDQWKDRALWRRVLSSHRVMVTTPQVLLDALHHGYIDMGLDIGLLIFDEAHHATGKHPYNMIMRNHYFDLPPRDSLNPTSIRVRPMVLGLTASPTYGANIDIAFRELERNLDCTIRSSRHNRDELAKFVHRPEFEHVLYPSPVHTWDNIPSVNYQSLQAVIATLNIEQDPAVVSLRARLARLAPGTDDYRLADQKLSKAIHKEDTFLHKGLRDFARTAEEICMELGTWAADWYIARVIERARQATNPYNSIMSSWQDKEKQYLLAVFARVHVVEPPQDPAAIAAAVTPKVHVLVQTLCTEEAIFRSLDEEYSGLVFVTRRDTVIALAELLRRLPVAAPLFRVGCLLGSSSTFRRHAFLDITRSLLDESQEETLRDFKIGDKNLIVSTSVAEEGIDIQACGSVVRFDVPQNVVSWAQSRGRARRKRSRFIIMFEETGPQDLVKKWEETERQMMAAYNDPRRDAVAPVEEEFDEMDGYKELEVASTGALLTVHSAIPHLNHFCAVIPSGGQESFVPVYELDPPDYIEGWHSLPDPVRYQGVYQGPWGATVTLPRALPPHLRKFTTDRIHRSKRRAQQLVAFDAYVALYRAGLLNHHLLPHFSVTEPEKEEEVKAMLAEVEKHKGTASVSTQMDPWSPSESEEFWFAHTLHVENLPPLRMFTRKRLPTFGNDNFPTLFVPHKGKLSMSIEAIEPSPTEDEIQRATEWTYRLFVRFYGARMEHGKTDFSYLFLPATAWPGMEIWDERRRWMADRISSKQAASPETATLASAPAFTEAFGHPPELPLVRGVLKQDRPLRLVGWRHERLSVEEVETFWKQNGEPEGLEISYPLMVALPLPKRRNFLIPFHTDIEDGINLRHAVHSSEVLLHPQLALIELASPEEVQYTLLLPSILRWLSMALTVDSLRSDLFARSPVSNVAFKLLETATTAPAAQEAFDYQRLETLGDTVLKFITSNHLYAEYPFWHEGYLSRKKDHTVANSSLAKEAVHNALYKWIIRDRFVPRKWKPHRISSALGSLDILDSRGAVAKNANVQDDTKKSKAKKNNNNNEDLSTKLLADVVESLIGAAYKHGSFDLAIDCAERFGLGLSWKKLPACLEAMHNVEDVNVAELPDCLKHVERMIDYSFVRPTFLLQALTHASYQGDSVTMSLERLEFLGDSALDMVVVDYLYHAEGKHYTPGYMHIKKEAIVNSHILAFVCLNTSILLQSEMPVWSVKTGLATVDDSQRCHLWQCLLHSSHRILEDQHLTSLRYNKYGMAIADALAHDSIYPWAALTSLQAPKFISDMVESLLGAVYVDSHGSLDAVRGVMRSLGLMQILERIVAADVDVLHPVSRLEIWAAAQVPKKEVEYKFQREKGCVSCTVVVDGVELVKETTSYRSKVSEDQVRFTVAEKANAMLQANVDVEFEMDSD